MCYSFGQSYGFLGKDTLPPLGSRFRSPCSPSNLSPWYDMLQFFKSGLCSWQDEWNYFFSFFILFLLLLPACGHGHPLRNNGIGKCVDKSRSFLRDSGVSQPTSMIRAVGQVSFKSHDKLVPRSRALAVQVRGQRVEVCKRYQRSVNCNVGFARSLGSRKAARKDPAPLPTTSACQCALLHGQNDASDLNLLLYLGGALSLAAVERTLDHDRQSNGLISTARLCRKP